MSEPIYITREKVNRGWNDIEPKLVMAGVTAFILLGVLIVAKQFHVALPPEVASAVTVSLSLFIGYLTPSAGTAVTSRQGSTVQEVHSGPTVTTVTAPVSIIRPATPAPVQQTVPQQTGPQEPVSPRSGTAVAPSDFTAIMDPPVTTVVEPPAEAEPDEQATEILPAHRSTW